MVLSRGSKPGDAQRNNAPGRRGQSKKIGPGWIEEGEVGVRERQRYKITSVIEVKQGKAIATRSGQLQMAICLGVKYAVRTSPVCRKGF